MHGYVYDSSEITGEESFKYDNSNKTFYIQKKQNITLNLKGIIPLIPL